MTNKEAIMRIKEHIRIRQIREPRAIKISEALYMAISALEAQDSPKPTAESVQNVQNEDLISRKAAIEALCSECQGKCIPCESYPCSEVEAINGLPSAQPDGWLEQNKDKILQAGMEGREIDFRIDGRLFAIREKAQ